MPNITAYLTIGKVEPVEGFVPTHWAYLVEAIRPTWYIAPAGLFSDLSKFKSTWPTSPETVVDDAMAMVATVVEDLPCLTGLIGSVTEHREGETVDLGQLSAASRWKLDRLNQAAKHTVHLVATVLDGSVFYGRMHTFVRYPVSVEIRTASYSQDGSLASFKWPDSGAAPTLDLLQLN